MSNERSAGKLKIGVSSVKAPAVYARGVTNEEFMPKVEVPREPQMATVVERQAACIGELEGSLRALAGRLDSVLNPPSPETAEKQTKLNPVRCQLGLQLDSHSDRIYAMTLVVADLLDRLAV